MRIPTGSGISSPTLELAAEESSRPFASMAPARDIRRTRVAPVVCWMATVHSSSADMLRKPKMYFDAPTESLFARSRRRVCSKPSF
eukprot:COSAG01_NODE_3432_length_6100_cov_58.074988_2_plen_86_part_00